MFPLLLLCLCSLVTDASPIGPQGQEGALLNAGLHLAAQFGEPTCDTKVVTASGPAFLAHTKQKVINIVGLTALRLALFMGYA